MQLTQVQVKMPILVLKCQSGAIARNFSPLNNLNEIKDKSYRNDFRPCDYSHSLNEENDEIN